MSKSHAGLGLALVLSVAGCHASYYEPAVPPPPPTEPPPGVRPAPPAEEEIGLRQSAAETPASAIETPTAQPSGSPSGRPAGPLPPLAATGQPAGPLPPLPSQAPQYAAAPAGEAPSSSQWVRSYPDGQWVYTSDYGWVWIPAGATSSEADGLPYAYLYTPHIGWTWYLSPWGWGAYSFGLWVTHPWRPWGWSRSWVASPHLVNRLNHSRPHRR